MKEIDYEKSSFENLIDFYREELIQLSRGTYLAELFTPYTRSKMVKCGVLKKSLGGFYLTEKTKKFLGIMKKIN